MAYHKIQKTKYRYKKGGDLMYKNLNVELARRGWNIIRLSEETGIKYQTLVTKMKGNSEFKFDECLAIKKAMGCKIPLEVLFLHQ